MGAERARCAREHHGAGSLEEALDVAEAAREAVVREDGEVEGALSAPLLLGEGFEGLHVVVEPQLLSAAVREAVSGRTPT